MRSTKQLSVTLPTEMAAELKAKVAAGEYASESEIVREGLRALRARERAIDTWLRQDVAAAYDAIKAEPKRARSPAQVRARLKAARAKSGK